jgi:DNA-binding GntR family transcriptional regulator
LNRDSLQLKFAQQPLSLKEMAVNSIKYAIIEGQLKPDTIYSDQNLAATLGISKTPVREALIELASKELLVHVPRKGFKIRVLSKRDVKKLWDYRMTLELSIVSMVVPSITDEGVKKLEAILSQNSDLLKNKSDSTQSIITDRSFHLQIAELSENPFFIKATKEVRDLCDLVVAWSHTDGARKYEAQEEHEKILEMIKLRSVDGSLAQMKHHLSVTRDKTLKNMKTSADTPHVTDTPLSK